VGRTERHVLTEGMRAEGWTQFTVALDVDFAQTWKSSFIRSLSEWKEQSGFGSGSEHFRGEELKRVDAAHHRDGILQSVYPEKLQSWEVLYIYISLSSLVPTNGANIAFLFSLTRLLKTLYNEKLFSFFLVSSFLPV